MGVQAFMVCGDLGIMLLFFANGLKAYYMKTQEIASR